MSKEHVKNDRLIIQSIKPTATWGWRDGNEFKDTGIPVGIPDKDFFVRKNQAKEIMREKFGTTKVYPYCSMKRNTNFYHPDMNVWWCSTNKFRTDIPVFLEDDQFYERIKKANEFYDTYRTSEATVVARKRAQKTFLNIAGDAGSFSYYISKWLESCIGIAPRTRRVYETLIANLKPLMGQKYNACINDLDSNYWINTISSLKQADGSPYSKGSIKHYLFMLSSVIKLAKDDGALIGNPMRNVSKRVMMVLKPTPKVSRDAYPPEVTWKLLKEAHGRGWRRATVTMNPKGGFRRTRRKGGGRTFNKVTWQSIFTYMLLAWDTGHNIQDILSWRHKDVDFDKRLIRGKRGKNGNAYVCGLQISTAQFLKKRMAKAIPTAKLCGKITAQSTASALARMAKNVIGDEASKYSNRSWRYALRSEMMRVGVSREVSSYIMGHKTAITRGDSTAHDIYLRVSDADVMKAYEAIELLRIESGYHLSEDATETIKRYQMPFRRLSVDGDKLLKFG